MTVCDDKGTHFHNVELSGSKYMSLACHKTSTKVADSLMAGYSNCIYYCHGCACVCDGNSGTLKKPLILKMGL